MADGRHLENRIICHSYLGIGMTDLHEIWHDDAYWSSEGYEQLKFPAFTNPSWQTAAI